MQANVYSIKRVVYTHNHIGRLEAGRKGWIFSVFSGKNHNIYANLLLFGVVRVIVRFNRMSGGTNTRCITIVV